MIAVTNNVVPSVALRDQFAMSALQAATEDYTLRCRAGTNGNPPFLPDYVNFKGQSEAVARMAYALADAMIVVRDETKGE